MSGHHHHGHNLIIRPLIAFVILIAGLAAKESIWIFSAAYLLAGFDVLFKAIKNIFRKSIFDENFLMSIATLGALAIGEYPEAAAVMILYQIGEYLQDRAVEKSEKAITELMDFRPDYANVEENGFELKKAAQDIEIGNIINVKPGERIPLDGIVIEGRAALDTSALTGESYPRNVKTGDKVLSSCINKNGILKIKVTKRLEDSTVSKILELVKNASSQKAKSEKFITKFAKFYTPIVVTGAVLLAILPPMLFDADFSVCFERALTFLVISCPCALVISIPLGFFAGIGAASKNGILVKGSSYLEMLSRPYAFVFDKTGTLTKGTFKVTKIKTYGCITENELLKLAALSENYSTHPIAGSIKEAYPGKIDANLIKDLIEIAGLGIQADIRGDIILVGNSRLMDKYNIKYPILCLEGTIVHIARNNVYLGYIVISDEIKEDAKQTIKFLKKLGKVIMLTGDSSDTAGTTAQRLGIENFYPELLPERKVYKIEEIINTKPKSKSVIFTGDGINDAPVLSRADVGIAMGGLGSDAAIEAADIVIMDDKPSKILTAVKISQKTMRIVKQNIVFAIGVKILFLVLGSIGFITMWGAVFADAGVALLAVLNSLRALEFETKKFNTGNNRGKKGYG